MTDLTVVILTKNEEKNLRKCVESFRGVAKRFVIVDSFSTDGTEALCKKLNEELQEIGSCLDFYQNKWISYANQLNWGLQNAGINTEWSMRMDADEEIMEDLAAEIDKKLPQIKEPVNGVILRRRVYFMFSSTLSYSPGSQHRPPFVASIKQRISDPDSKTPITGLAAEASP